MLATVTNGEVLARNQIDTHGIEHLDLTVPILSGVPQRQGDVLVIPVPEHKHNGTAVPQQGVTIVRGESTGGTPTSCTRSKASAGGRHPPTQTGYCRAG